jgi:hypothetical protein
MHFVPASCDEVGYARCAFVAEDAHALACDVYRYTEMLGHFCFCFSQKTRESCSSLVGLESMRTMRGMRREHCCASSTDCVAIK